MNIKTLLTIMFISTLYSGKTQTNVHYTDSTISKLIDRYRSVQKNNKIKVYRIQLKSSQLEDVVIKTKKKYKALFPNEITYETYEQPDFKLVTGAYLNKKQAEKKLYQIIGKFKHAFIFQEEISIEIFKAETNH